MSILIKGIKLSNCWGCPCCSFQDNGFAGWDHYCNLLDEFVNDYHHSRHKLCPLIEVLTPHGRLIDADKIEYHFEVNGNTAMEGCEFVTKGEIGRVPTVIEAEE